MLTPDRKIILEGVSDIFERVIAVWCQGGIVLLIILDDIILKLTSEKFILQSTLHQLDDPMLF